MTFKVKDHYFNKAKKENFLARSIYKLEEIDQRYKVIKSGDLVLDLGYHPGSWVQYTSQKVGDKGVIVGIDIKEINTRLTHLKNVNLFQKDIFDVHDLADLGVQAPFNTVLSDMAPNTTGIKSLDQDRSLNLIEAIFTLLPKFLRYNGNTVMKVFDSHGAQVFLKEQKKLFNEFHYLKPKSTRSVSKEFFVIGKGYKGP